MITRRCAFDFFRIDMALSQTLLLFLVIGMLFTGTINTLLNKLQDLTCVENCRDLNRQHHVLFEQPLWQVKCFLFYQRL